jgi:hypothetical protein
VVSFHNSDLEPCTALSPHEKYAKKDRDLTRQELVWVAFSAYCTRRMGGKTRIYPGPQDLDSFFGALALSDACPTSDHGAFMESEIVYISLNE